MYLRDITFLTDVSVPAIETIKLVFKPVFLKQFHFLKPLDIFEIGKKGTSVKKVTTRDANEDVDKVCIEVQKILITQVENLHAISHFIQHKTFSALNYAQDFRNRMNESLKRTTNSKSRIVPCQILSSLSALSTMSLPSVQTMTKEDEVGIGVDRIENFRPV